MSLMVRCFFTGVYRLYGFYGPMVVRNTDHVLSEPLREPKCSKKGESVVGNSVVPRNDLVLRSSTTLWERPVVVIEEFSLCPEAF